MTRSAVVGWIFTAVSPGGNGVVKVTLWSSSAALQPVLLYAL